MKWSTKTRKNVKLKSEWGYDPSDADPLILKPNVPHLEELERVVERVDTGQLSIGGACRTLEQNTGRSISRTGLVNICKRKGKYKTRMRVAHKSTNKTHKQQVKDLKKVGKHKEASDKEVRLLKQKLHGANKRRATLANANDVVAGKTPLVSPKVFTDTPKAVKESMEGKNIVFQPNPGPQTTFLASSEREVFYGGARGGGKSYAMLVDCLRYVHKQACRALILRRTMPELRELIEHSRRMYPALFPKAKFNEESKTWRFPSGARIEFGYAENRIDALRYQGQSYTWIGVDELPQYPDPGIWNDLRGSLRSVDPEIPEYMRATGNPGNVGSGWVKDLFIDPAPWGEPFRVRIKDASGGEDKFITRRFVPAKLSDNPFLTRTDSYKVMLMTLPEVQRQQWLEGNWDVYDNAAFPEFDRKLHVIEPFEIPHNWTKWRACDWGYRTPACVLWMAQDYNGTIYVYREYYGTGLDADEFSRHILGMEMENVRYGIMDSSVWAARGDTGPSIVDVMAKNGLKWRPSDRSPGSRKARKMELHRKLRVWQDDEIDYSDIYFFNTCTNLIRTLPTLPVDVNDPEDVDTKAEDHSYDACTYGLMSRVAPPSYSGMKAQKARRPVALDSTFGY